MKTSISENSDRSNLFKKSVYVINAEGVQQSLTPCKNWSGIRFLNVK